MTFKTELHYGFNFESVLENTMLAKFHKYLRYWRILFNVRLLKLLPKYSPYGPV